MIRLGIWDLGIESSYSCTKGVFSSASALLRPLSMYFAHPKTEHTELEKSLSMFELGNQKN